MSNLANTIKSSTYSIRSSQANTRLTVTVVRIAENYILCSCSLWLCGLCTTRMSEIQIAICTIVIATIFRIMINEINFKNLSPFISQCAKNLD